MKTRLGTDPEVFVTDGLTYSTTYKGTQYRLYEAIPPEALIQDYGFKASYDGKNKVLFETEYGKVVDDGVACEIHIPPTNNKDVFHRGIYATFNQFKKYVRSKDSSLKLIHDLATSFNKEKYWEGRGDEFKDCVRIGCEPDRNPYAEFGLERESTSRETDTTNYPFRFGGGHIHIENPMTSNMEFFKDWIPLTILLDHLVGTFRVAHTSSNDIKKKEILRLENYGKPGRVRLKEYPNGKAGLEYRVLSNDWISKLASARYAYRYPDTILTLCDIAVHVVERGLVRKYLEENSHRLEDVYYALLSFDIEGSKHQYNKTIKWLYKNHILGMSTASRISKGRVE